MASPPPPTPFLSPSSISKPQFWTQIGDFCTSGELLARFGSKKGIPGRSDPTQGAHLGVFFGTFCAHGEELFLKFFATYLFLLVCGRFLPKRTQKEDPEATKLRPKWNKSGKCETCEKHGRHRTGGMWRHVGRNLECDWQEEG